MKTISRYASLISVTSLLAGTALVAQTSGSASPTSPSSDPTTPGATSTRPYNSTNSGAPASTSPGLSGSTSSSEVNSTGAGNIHSSAAQGVRSSGAVGASGSTSGVTLNSGASDTLGSSAFSGMADPLASSIQGGEFTSRTQLAGDIEQRLDTQKDSLKTLKQQGKDLEGQARTDFKAAWDEVESREKDLKRSLRQARNASQDQWESARSELSSSYQAYQAAIARAQMQAGGASVTFPSGSGSTDSSMNPNSGVNSPSSDMTRQDGRGATSGSSATDTKVTR